MAMKTIAFFNSNESVIGTALVYHLACMLADRNETVLAVDLDPQANLTSMFIPEDADGVIGAHGEAVRNAYADFLTLARRIADRSGSVLA